MILKFNELRFATLFVAGLLSGGIGLFSCQDSDKPVDVSSSTGENLFVSLNINFSSEVDDYALSSGTHTRGAEDGRSAFSVKRLSQTETRTADLHPDALYELHILQFEQNGNQIGSTQFTAGAAIGQKLEITLAAKEDCQLLIIARGKGNTSPAINGSLTSVRTVSMDQSVFNAIPTTGATQEQINKMPYVLHLSHVKVVDAGSGKGTIQSTESGTNDVRLLLKRLASRVTVNWTYSVADYDLKQILLQSIPLNYALVPSPDASDGTYPSLLDQFTTISVPTVTNSGSYFFWVPANVRGESGLATSPQQRTKDNSPVGSSFLNFVAANRTDSKKKLDYRVYLGGTKSSDFNLNAGTDYNYQVNFAHVGIPTGDKRVTYIDPIPASEGNDNFLPTANCFMASPGGSFCFDPFMYRQNGADIENTVLAGWSTQIQSVKLLWQTKENGDVGDPVMGIVNSADDHTNIVDIKNTDGTSAPYMKGKARIYCKVAAGTTGGSGVIAAYDGPNGTGNILWSWHIWVTEYNPSPTGNATVLEPVNKRKLKLVYAGLSGQYPMMDRNLGAFASYDAIPGSILEMSRANGFHYQKGRKDPFPSSYTTEQLPEVYKFTLSADAPPKHIQNRYQADGFRVLIPQDLAYSSLQNAYRHPLSIATGLSLQWCSDRPIPTWSTTKTVHDPCPAGWRIPEKSELQALVNYNTTSTYPDLWQNAKENGGLLLKYDGAAHRTYLRFTGYPPSMTQLNYVGLTGYISVLNDRNAFEIDFRSKSVRIGSWENYDAHTTRCIQERAD